MNIPTKKQLPSARAVQLNGETGEVEAEVQDGQRIFSIPDTQKIVRLAATAKDEKDLDALGRFVAKAIRKQDSNAPEYTNE